MKRILLLEDDLFTSRMLKKTFENLGFIVVQSFDISSAYYAAVENNFSIAIFDVQLPSGSSLDSFKRIKKTLNCPIIIYTSKEGTNVELKSLDVGAEDFLLKQRGVDILISRINRVLLNEKNNEKNNEKKIENQSHKGDSEIIYNINKSERIFYYNDNAVQLTKNEANILSFILSQDDFFADRDELSYSTKGHSYDGWSRALDLAISRLRQKLQKQTNNDVTLTSIRGKGYKISFSSNET